MKPFNCVFFCSQYILLYQCNCKHTEIVSEYDQKISQSQTADKPMAPRGRESEELRKANQAKQPALSSPLR